MGFSEDAANPQEPPKETAENNQEAKSSTTNIDISPILVNTTSQASETTEDKSYAAESAIGYLKKELPKTEFKLLSTIYSLTKENLDRGVELNRTDISTIINIGKSSISKATVSLRQKDLIQIEAIQRSDGRNVNVYRLNIRKIKDWKN